MFKNETLVIAVVCTLVLGFSVLASAANGPDRYSDRPTSLDVEIWRAECQSGNIAPENVESCKQLRQKALTGSTGGGCGSADSDFTKAAGEAVNACGAFSQAGDSDTIGCGQAIEKCQCLYKSSTEKARRPICTDVPDRVRSATTLNLPDLERRFRACPALAGKDLDKLETEAKEARKALQDAQNKANEAQKTNGNAGKEARKRTGEIRDKMAQEAEKLMDKDIEIKRAKEDALNQLRKEVRGLEDQILAKDVERSKLRIKRKDIDIRYQEAMSNIRIGCHQIALNETTALQKEEAIKLQARVMNLGTYGETLGNVGRTARKRWQGVALDRYEKCRRSDVTHEDEKKALKVRDLALDDAEADEAKVEEEKTAIRQKIRDIQNKNFCTGQDQTSDNGTTEESASCQAIRKGIEDGEKARKAYAIKQANLLKDARDAQQDAAEAIAAEAKANGQAQTNLAAEQGRLSELEALINLKKRFAGGEKMDDKEYKDATNKHKKLTEVAKQLLQCKATAGADACKNSAECTRAAKYLNSISMLEEAEYNAAGGIGVIGSPRGGNGPGFGSNNDDVINSEQ